MIHFFNPGHETAVLNASKYYQPPANQVKMQADLAFLPAWYADEGDWVLIVSKLPPAFQNELQKFAPMAQAFSLANIPDRWTELSRQSLALWGISPQSVHYFDKINRQYDLHWQIPAWRDTLRDLGNRFAGKHLLTYLLDQFPILDKEILPQTFSSMQEIETYLLQCNERQLLKSPYSSSGRGLLWLPPGKLAQSERQIIHGMLKKQSAVSIEKALEKQLDFSMHFEINPERQTQCIGYSVFQTNEKGHYEKSFLASQTILKEKITKYIDENVLHQIQQSITEYLQQQYASEYTGNIGVDMLVYRSGEYDQLHPCIEINMRKSMGYLAIQLHEKHLHPTFRGFFQIDYSAKNGDLLQKHLELQTLYPLKMRDHRLLSGYLNLCPIEETSRYHAYIYQ
jgi:hypothetical protein